jgi:UDPglucose 6-dehydrogenase
MKICIYGLWHLGSVAAASLANLNYEVIGLDFDKKSICKLSYCKSIVSDPDLGSLY